MHVNLLPASTRLAIQFDQQLRVYLKLWIAVGLLTIIYFTYQLFLCNAAQQQLTKLETDCDPIQQLQKRIETQHQMLAVLQNRKTRLVSLQSHTHPVTILGSVVQSIAAQPGKIRLQRLTIQHEQDLVAAPGNKPAASGAQASLHKKVSSRQCVALTGSAEDDASLSQLISDMKRIGLMDRVELKSSSRSANSAARQFHIEAWLGETQVPKTHAPVPQGASPGSLSARSAAAFLLFKKT